MASAWRVVAFFTVVFVVPAVLIVVPLHARYSRYPSRSEQVVRSDTLDLHSWASSFWCQGQRMTANTSYSAYLLPGPVKRSSRRRRLLSVTDVLGISEIEPDYHHLHLLKGSHVQMAACSRWPGAQVIVVKGKENFKKCFYREDRQLQRFEEIRLIKSRNVHTGVVPTQMTEVNRVKARVRGVMGIGNEDVFLDDQDEPNDAGEVFDVDGDTKQRYGVLNTTEIRSSERNSSDTAREDQVSKNFGVKDETLNSTNVYGDFIETNSTEPPRAQRSIVSTLNPDDGSDEKTRLEGLAMEATGILLHSIDDTRDVTAGNSSMSSSEEFMEDCSDTIAMINITSSRDCQSRNVELEEIMHSYSINETGEYYFIFMSDNTIEENVMKYHMTIDRVMFSLKDLVASCNNTRDCSLPLGFLSRQGVALEVDGEEFEEVSKLEAFEIQVVCQPRVAVYMVFILLVPFLLMFFAFQ